MVVAFRICSIITRLVLNFPESLIGKVLETAKIPEILGIPKGHEFEDRMRLGIRNHNLGILYYLICCALPKDSAEKKSKLVPGVEKALSRLGVSLEAMSDEAAKEVDEVGRELSSSKLNAIRALSQSGVDNFHKIPFSSTGLEFSGLSLPTVYLGDGFEVRVFGNEKGLLNNVGLEEIFNELYEGHEWVERFSEACTA